MSVTDFNKISFQAKREKVVFKSITGVESQSVVFKYEQGEQTDHSHEAEQIRLSLSGEGELFIEGKKFRLKAGVTCHILSRARQGFNVTSAAGLELVESYAPAKPENIMAC